jgi:hypothetical protein
MWTKRRRNRRPRSLPSRALLGAGTHISMGGPANRFHSLACLFLFVDSVASGAAVASVTGPKVDEAAGPDGTVLARVDAAWSPARES